MKLLEPGTDARRIHYRGVHPRRVAWHTSTRCATATSGARTRLRYGHEDPAHDRGRRCREHRRLRGRVPNDAGHCGAPTCRALWPQATWSRVPYLVMEYVQWPHAAALAGTRTARRHRRGGPAGCRRGPGSAMRSTSKTPFTWTSNPPTCCMREDGSTVLAGLWPVVPRAPPRLAGRAVAQGRGLTPLDAPEQVVGVRGDPRSDVFAIGVMLYQLCTGDAALWRTANHLGGLRQRLLDGPGTARANLRPDMPAWLQEVVLRCLEPVAAQRYPSAAHLAFDLSHTHRKCTSPQRGRKKLTGHRHSAPTSNAGLRAAGMQYAPSPMPAQQIERSAHRAWWPLPYKDVSDATLYSLREAAARSLGTRPGARLALRDRHFGGLTSSLGRRARAKPRCTAATSRALAPMGPAAGCNRLADFLPCPGVGRRGPRTAGVRRAATTSA